MKSQSTTLNYYEMILNPLKSGYTTPMKFHEKSKQANQILILKHHERHHRSSSTWLYHKSAMSIPSDLYFPRVSESSAFLSYALAFWSSFQWAPFRSSCQVQQEGQGSGWRHWAGHHHLCQALVVVGWFYSLVMSKYLLNMAIEIVSFPRKQGDFP